MKPVDYRPFRVGILLHPEPRAARRYAPPPRQAGQGQYDTLAFVLGLAGFLIGCFPVCAFGWYFGHKARAEAQRAGREPDGLATAGWVLGIIGTVLAGGLSVLFAIGFFIALAGGM